jgi:hypothetical protein
MIIEMQIKIKLSFLDNGYRIGKNGKVLRNKIKYN